jgi:hypothetical protein
LVRSQQVVGIGSQKQREIPRIRRPEPIAVTCLPHARHRITILKILKACSKFNRLRSYYNRAVSAIAGQRLPGRITVGADTTDVPERV